MTSRVIGVLLSTLLLATSPAHGQVNHGDFTVPQLGFLGVTETTQTAGDPAVLWGAPTFSFPFDGLAFSPPAFASECSSGGSDVTSSLLSMDISSPSGAAILTVSFAEAGETMLTTFPPFGTPVTNASVSTSGTVVVTEGVGGPIAPVVIPFTGTFSPSSTFSLPGVLS